MSKNDIELLSDKERIVAFKRIEQNFYDHNFGTMSKSDFEIIIFDIYITHLLDNGKNFDDYTMSKALGITQSRVRALKAKKELRFPRKGFKWEEAFAEDVKRATYDKDSRKISFIISDINVVTELRYYMEMRGWFDEYQLNPRLFTCRTDFFVKLCAELSDTSLDLDEASREKLNAIAVKSKNENDNSVLNKILTGALDDGLKSLMISGSKMLITEVLKVLPFGGIAASIITTLIEIIS